MDILNILEYKNHADAINKHVDKEYKMKYGDVISKIGTSQNAIHSNPNITYINEVGVYSLIFGSKLESAKKIKKFVFEEVLPSIRKNGYFVSDSITNEKVKELETKIKSIEEENKLKTEKLKLENSLIKADNKNKAEEIRIKTVNIKMINNFLDNDKSSRKKEIIYIAATKTYSQQNLFKVGMCASRKLMKKRLSAYNTGRPQNDLYYFAYIEETPSGHQLENRIKGLLNRFLDKQGKEMYNIHYTSLVSFVELIRKNYSEEINELDKFIDSFMNELTAKIPFIPDPIILDALKIDLIIDGKSVESHIADLSKMSNDEQNAIISEMFDLFRARNDSNEIKRKEFEAFLAGQKYSFKKIPVWNQLKTITKSVKDVILKY